MIAATMHALVTIPSPFRLPMPSSNTAALSRLFCSAKAMMMSTEVALWVVPAEGRSNRGAATLRGEVQKGHPSQKLHILPDDQLVEIGELNTSKTSSSEGGHHFPRERIILVDGNAILYRAYYKVMTQVHYGKLGDVDSEGDWVLTVFTTLSTVLRLLELYPSHIAVIFDHTGLTFRHTLFPAYKGNRPPTPDTLQQGLHYIKPALLAMAMKVIEVPGVEADDVIGTLALTAVAAGMKVRIASPDKDFFQILSSELRLLRFVPRGSGIVSFGIEEFAQRYGNLKPSQFVDVMALVGDKVDNIPGVVGIGEKTAIQLISQYGSLEKVLEERNDVTIQRARKCLLEEKGEALLSKRLVALRADLPSYMIPYSLKDLSLQKPDDGGENFFQLLKAMASYVDGPYFNDLQQRSLDFWKKV
ncbi:hypothetical protein O6H91_12G004000 [Diphasiastrum complanatum]|uniref:Uncharacterized protein n=1 Tax=Diphasiastrum complanatum TaxID=34168 RepID=A0ACC2BYI4_DIPCM|nr:hypothetical protein O6H91_12G004000 [Diphasiastrum complanatum]